MIHTDGKPTIANNPYAAHRVAAKLDSDTAAILRDHPQRIADDAEFIARQGIRIAELENRIKSLETDCPCAQCSEYDPDSAPGGYDSPSGPIDWSTDE